MQTVLIVIHLMVVVALVIVVLLQRSEGGALGIGGSSGTGGLFTGRGQANALTRATAVLAGIFFATSIALTILASYSRAPSSIFPTQQPGAPAGQTAPGQGGGSLLDDLKTLQEKAPANAPASPSAPAAPQSR